MGTSHNEAIGLIILAAGDSSRLGEPKQLLKFENKTMIFRIAQAGLRSLAFPVQIVLGAQYRRVLRKIENLPVYIDVNPDWEQGMSSSIVFGMEKILKIVPDLDAIVLAVCDQPYVTGQVINDLILTYLQTEFKIVGAAYHEQIGVPAIFNKELFRSLLALKGDKGARDLIRNTPSDQIRSIPFELGEVDIDTYEDYFREIKKFEVWQASRE